MPYYLSLGVSEEYVDNSCPTDLKPYEMAHKQRMQEIDWQLWLNGKYIESAVYCAIDKAFSGRKSKAEYVKENILSEFTEKDSLTEEEKAEMEIRKAIANEEMWRLASLKKGLPDTEI